MTSANRIATLLLIVMFLANSGTGRADNLPMRKIAKGAMSGVREAKQEVIKTKSDWELFWSKHSVNQSAVTAIPDVDFGKETVVAVIMGQQRTGGFTIEIIGVESEAEKLVISIKRSSPPKGAMVIQALTTPFHIVAVPRSDLKPEFVEVKQTTPK